MKDRDGDDIPCTWAPGYVRGNGEVRLLNPYLGETFATLQEAKEWAAEEEHVKYLPIMYFAIAPVEAAGPWAEPE